MLSKRNRELLEHLKAHMATPVSDEAAAFWDEFEREIEERHEDAAVGRHLREGFPAVYACLLAVLAARKEGAE